ncbi:uncharacterized protein LTR77_007503 [Saxophila tyrrhenica]|uniref:Uncharacterized protein n=1 Tax=Saxophila tyrrhenica TaxID=1690608 RepID=A0AAV9P4Q5_9PEZI|nr:hypothetical protein LTR77_007503 [Saxophila tyrrhenica]
MAEALGLAASVIEVSNEAFALGKYLIGIVQDYRNAPYEISQIASELFVYSELMGPLAEHLKAGSVNYSAGFKQSVENIARNTIKLFNELEALMPPTKADGTIDKGVGARLTFAFRKGKIAEVQDKVFRMRDTFRFIKEGYEDQMRRAQPVGTNGMLHGEPVTLSGPGRDSSGNQVNFSVTLVMRPAQSSTYSSAPITREKAEAQPQLRRPEGYLQALRQSPYFSAGVLLSSPSSGMTRAYREAPKDPAVEKIAAREWARRKPSPYAAESGYAPGTEYMTKSRMSRESAESSSETADIPDDAEAARDVDALLASWFGGDNEQSTSGRPALTVVEPEEDEHEIPMPYSRTPPRSPKTARAPSPAGHYVSGSDPFTCDSCNQEVSNNERIEYDQANRIPDPRNTLRM